MCRIVAAMILCSLRGRNIAHVSNLSTNSSSNSRNVVAAQPFAVSVVSSSCRRPRNLLSGGHTGGASGAVHQGPRPLGAHQRGPIAFFEKLISSVSHVASHSGYCREIVF